MPRLRNKERLEALYDIIKLCKNKNAKVILITTPLTDTLTDMIKERNPEYLEEFYATVENIADEQGVEYYDYAMDEVICCDN